MALKTDYKNDKFEGSRKWKITDNSDGTYTLEDGTDYETNGDIFNADDINTTNTQINTNTSNISKYRTELQGNIDTNQAANTKLVQVTLSASGWSSSAPYTQTVAVSGMTTNDKPTPGIVYPDSFTEAQKASIDKGSGMITKLETVNGGIRATCRFKRPEIDLILSLKGV